MADWADMLIPAVNRGHNNDFRAGDPLLVTSERSNYGLQAVQEIFAIAATYLLAAEYQLR